MYNHIMLSIDELFDVRTATLQSVTTTDQFVKVLDRGWGGRSTDRYDDIVPYDTYLAAYAARDITTVQSSTVTMVIPIIRDALAEAMHIYGNSPLAERPILYIHIPPRYRFTDEDKQALGQMLVNELGDGPLIEFVYRPLITLEALDKLKVGLFFIYDVLLWIADIASSGIVDARMLSPGTTVLSAKVHTSDAKYNAKTLTKACALLEVELKPVCMLKYVPCSVFTSPLLVKPFILPRQH